MARTEENEGWVRGQATEDEGRVARSSRSVKYLTFFIQKFFSFLFSNLEISHQKMKQTNKAILLPKKRSQKTKATLQNNSLNEKEGNNVPTYHSEPSKKEQQSYFFVNQKTISSV